MCFLCDIINRILQVNNDIQEEYLMLKSSNKVETNVYQLEVAIDGAEFEKAVQQAYLKQRKNIAVKPLGAH